MELVSTAVIEFGLTRKQFFELSPREFNAYSKRATEKIKREDLRIGLLAAHITNMMSKKGSETLTAADFFPQWAEESLEQRREKKRVSKVRGEVTLREMIEKGKAVQRIKEMK